ncbi:M61 family metallopeptidase [Psychrobacter sp. 2Y5]|uniref:M61 family metallopeptidase n=1 Tax=unclassified Psychrobacter TaxID=196806 RepID=UPI003F47DD84
MTATTFNHLTESLDNKKTALSDNTATISYSLDFARFNEHLVDVTLSFTATMDSPELWLPAWIPGSYLMREFARNITAVHYEIVANKPTKSYRAQKIDKHSWQLPEVTAGQAIKVQYEVYCYDLSVRSAYVDQQRLYGNFTSLTVAVAGQELSPVQVSLLVPAAFIANNNNGATTDSFIDNNETNQSEVVLACGLKASHLQLDNHHGYGLQADDYYQLIDHPFEIALQQSFDFIIQDDEHQTLPHSFYLSGRHNANMGRLQHDVTQICQTYLNWLGDAPFNDYTFMTYASGQDYGGLEHINSTSLITPRNDLPSGDEPVLPSPDYQRFLGLCSHEYFHAWWVKTVRPDVMMEVDLRREAFTPLLWVFEGFTSYIDDFMLQASGVIDKPSYLKLLAEQINRYYQTDGRANQSVAESSFDAWIKLYRSDENTGNAGISYYNKGALVALCLDLTLQQKTNGRYRLFDVVKAFYEQAKQNNKQRIGISSADMGAVISEFMSQAEWQDFEQRYINGVEELPIKTLLSANGISWHENEIETADKNIPWGMRCSEAATGLKVNRVQRGSIAATAGISANDIIVAIDGIKATSKQLGLFSPLNQPVSCHLFRRDELMTMTILPKQSADTAIQGQQAQGQQVFPHKISLTLVNTDSAEQEADKTASAWLDVLSD